MLSSLHNIFNFNKLALTIQQVFNTFEKQEIYLNKIEVFRFILFDFNKKHIKLYIFALYTLGVLATFSP